MFAGDLVGEDLEAGLGVDLRPIRQQQVVVGLLGVGAVGTRAHVDATVEHAGAGVVEHATERLTTRAVRLRVHDVDLLVENLLTDTEVQPGQLGDGTGTVQLDVDRRDGRTTAPRLNDRACTVLRAAWSISVRARCTCVDGRSWNTT